MSSSSSFFGSLRRVIYPQRSPGSSEYVGADRPFFELGPGAEKGPLVEQRGHILGVLVPLLDADAAESAGHAAEIEHKRKRKGLVGLAPWQKGPLCEEEELVEADRVGVVLVVKLVP